MVFKEPTTTLNMRTIQRGVVENETNPGYRTKQTKLTMQQKINQKFDGAPPLGHEQLTLHSSLFSFSLLFELLHFNLRQSSLQSNRVVESENQHPSSIHPIH